MKYETQEIKKIADELNLSILYVEDEKNTSDLMVGTIKSIIETVYVAYDGVEGLDLYKAYNPDIVITDIVMPNMNGITMSKEIKKINPNQSILFVTAFGDKASMSDAIKLKVDGFIEKPIDIDLFIDVLYKALENKILKHQLEKKEIIIFEQYKNLAMKDMLSNIAHQWRQPLNSISIEASNIAYSIELDDMDRDAMLRHANSIVEKSKKLSNIIEIFNHFVDNNKTQKTNLCIKDTITKVIEIVNGKLKTHNIDLLGSFLDPESIEIFANENDITKVILNIINNAKDILLSQEINNKWIKIEVGRVDDNVLITIEDNGGGIPPTDMPRIFEAYYTTKHQTQGKGLGLYMCYEIIVEDYLGNLYAKNTQNGAKLFIEIPLKN